MLILADKYQKKQKLTGEASLYQWVIATLGFKCRVVKLEQGFGFFAVEKM